MRHLRTSEDLTPDETRHLVDWALRLKSEHAAGQDRHRLAGRVLGLFFEKPSMRTRVSFESAIAHLGGSSVFLSREDIGLGTRESVPDFARVISRYVDVLCARVYSHDVILELADWSTCPVINALSDYQHPCQALADLCTMQEACGRLDGLRLVFVGDGNNVSRSLALVSLQCGVDFVLCSPGGYEFSPEFLSQAQAHGWPGKVSLESDPVKAVAGADVVYTDVWASMGQEQEKASRLRDFANYQVNAAMMSRAKPTAKFLHCLPAHRGEEVAADVIDGPMSLVFDQAEYRLHAQKALMLWLLQQ